MTYHDGQQATDRELPYHLADEWMLTDFVEAWQCTSERRRAERSEQPRFEARAVLFGKPLCRFLAESCRAACRSHRPQSDEEVEEIIREVHSAWLTTPREDLRGAAPRDVLLADRCHIDFELSPRRLQHG